MFSWKTAQEIMDVPGQQQAAGVVGKEKQAEMQEMHSENGVGQDNNNYLYQTEYERIRQQRK